jgi:hypothetical protein
MANKAHDLIIVNALAAIAVILVLVNFNPSASLTMPSDVGTESLFVPFTGNTILSMVHIVFGLPLVLVWPGYALTTALFPSRELSFSERLLFITGLSLASVIVIGLGLNYTPWGIQANTWALSLGAVTWLGSLIAFIRRPDLVVLVQRDKTMPKLDPNLGQSLLAGLAMLIVVGTVVFAQNEAENIATKEVVQLWILPGGATTPGSVRVGVSSSGPHINRFILTIHRDGYKIKNWPLLELAPGERWETQLVLPLDLLGSGPIEVWLYRSDAPNVIYRRVAFWPEYPSPKSR